MPPEIKFDLLVGMLGGPATLSRKLEERGFGSLKEATVYAWVRRNHIPGAWVIPVLMVAQAEGLATDLGKLVRRPAA